MTLYASTTERYSYIDIKRAIACGYTHIQLSNGRRLRLVKLLPLFDEWYE